MGHFKGILPLLLLLDCIYQTLFVQGRIIGCHGFGSVATDESDRPLLEKLQPLLAKELIEFTEEECQAYMRYISQPVNRRNESRDERLVWHQNRTDIQGHAECNRRGWLMSGFPAWCHCFYEAEGENCEGESRRSSRPPKGAVVYLLYGDEKYFWMLLDAIEHLHLSFLDKFPSHSILVFHSANFRGEVKPGIHSANFRGEIKPGISYLDMIRAKSDKVTLIEIELDFPESLKAQFQENPPDGGVCKQENINYLHMNRFFTHALFRHPAIREFDYLWRTDADLYHQIEVPCDIFDVMRKSHAVFGYYYYDDREWTECGGTEGFRAASAYASQRGFAPNHLDLMPISSAYLGGFGVLDVRFWTSELVLDFGEVMDKTGLVYTTRLSDQVHFVLATSVFAPPAALHQYAKLGPFRHRFYERIWGRREINGFNLIDSDPYCPEANEWDCDDFFECVYVGAPGGGQPNGDDGDQGVRGEDSDEVLEEL